MKLSESLIFIDICKSIMDFYENWYKDAYEPAKTKRAAVAVSNVKNTVCLVVFKGSKKDCFDIKEFLEKKDKKK